MNTKLKIIFIPLFITFTFISCKKSQSINQTLSSNGVKYDLTDSVPKKKCSAITVFKIKDFSKIQDYKSISFESKKYLLDNYVSEIDKETFISDYSSYHSVNLGHDSLFFIETNYGKVKFESVKDIDAFHEYHYLNDIQLSNYKIVEMFTLDYPITIFLNIDNYGGFTTEGEIFISKTKSFFVSISNTPDYCLFEVYAITKNGISNIVNLYSNYYQIDKISWNNSLLFETVISNEQRNYCKIDFEKLLSDFESNK